MNHLISPSLLAADFSRLAEEVDLVNNSVADWLHIDVMDGCFVPNISYAFPVLQSIRDLVQKPLDVHLMIVQPERFLERFRDAGAEMITVHAEACVHLHSVIQQIKATGAKAGVAINPHTPVSVLQHVLEDLDLVLVMSVNPGFGGQKFIYQSLEKIRSLRSEIIERNLEVHIEVDGGIGLHNAESVLHAGADVLVAGSAIFGAPDPKDVIRRMKSIDLDTIMV